MSTDNCCKGDHIKSIFLVDKKDVNQKTGKIKRKYGRFKREIIRIK